VIVILLLNVLSAKVSHSSELVLTFNEAVDVALKNNPELKAFKWVVEAGSAEVDISKAYYYPKLTVEERLSSTNSPTYTFMGKLNQERLSEKDFLIERLNSPEHVTDFQTTVTLLQPLFVPRIKYGIEVSKEMLSSAQKQYERRKEEILFRLYNAYLRVQTAKQFLEVAEKGLEDAKEHLRLAELRYRAGTGLYSDVLRAEVSLKDAEKRMVAAESALYVAKRALGLILGKTVPVDIKDEDIVLPLKDLSFYESSLSRRADLSSLQKRYSALRKAVSLERSMLLPEVGLTAVYQMNDHRSPFGAEGESYTVAVVLRWSFFDPTIRARIKKKEAEANQMKELLAGFQQEISFRINEAYQKVREKQKNLELSKVALKEAEEAMRLVRIRYENSLSPFVDLLDTQMMLQNARAKLVEAENNYSAAVAELYYQSGQLLLEFLRATANK
jgi:outer membrane protein TolC